MFFAILFTLSAIIPALALFFTVDESSARLFTINANLSSQAGYTLFAYDMVFVGWAYAYVAIACTLNVLIQLARRRPFNFNYLLGMVVFSYFYAFYASVGVRFQKYPYFIAVVVAYLALYALAFNENRNFTCTKRAGGVLVALVLSVAGVYLAVLVMSWVKVPNPAVPLQFGVSLGLFAVLVLIGVVRGDFHVHHFIWSTVLVFVTNMDSYSCLCMQAMALSVSLHGMSMFGYDRLFETTPP